MKVTSTEIEGVKIIETAGRAPTEYMDQLKEWNATLMENDMSFNEDGTIEHDLLVRRKSEITYEEVTAFAKDRDDIISYSYNSLYNHFR